MVLNEREKVIAWVVGGVGVAALLYFGANMLYFTPLKDLEKKHDAAMKKKAEIEDTVKKAKVAYNDWTNMSIQSSSEAIEGPTRSRIYQLAEQNFFQINTYSGSNPRALAKQADFQEVIITASADTTTSRLARFLVMLESQHDLAMRVDKVNIQSKKPGSDDLHVDMQIRTLLYAPKDKKMLALVPPPSTPPIPGVNTGTPRNTGVRTAANGAAGTGQVALVTPGYQYNILNAMLGSLDPAIPGDDKTPMEERLKLRRQYQLEGKPLGKPRFGEAPLELLPGETPEQGMARRKAEQMKAAATQAAADEEARKKAEEANAPKLLPGETMEQYLVRHRKEQDALDNATTKPAGGN